MNIPRLKVPVLPKSATIDEAIKQMRAHNVSASVVKVGDGLHLLDFETAVARRREPSQGMQSVAALVHGLTLPQVNKRDLETWFAEPSVVKGAPRAPITRQYALLGVTGGTAEIATRAGLLGTASASPVMYECSVDPDHGSFTATEVGTPPMCPMITHHPPKPPAILIV